MTYRFADCVLDTERRELRRDGKTVPLEPQVFDLLLFFVRRPDGIVLRSELIDRIWGGRFVSDATIDSRIATARRAIGDNGSKQALIRTVPKRGFRFVVPVAVDPSVESLSQPPLPKLPSIAVLPFENMSTDPRLRLAADILVEDVTALLARQGGLFVVCTRSAALYQGRDVDVRAVGRELGVRYVVTGSVRQGAGRATIVVNLVDACSGAQRWSGHLDASQTDLPDLQRDLARCVISEIEPALNSAELEVIRRRGERDLDAWMLYREAMGKIAAQGWKTQSFGEARELLQRAVRLDPRFALGWAYLAMQTALAEVFGILPGTRALHTEIRQLAQMALEADPNDSQVLSWVACAYADIGDGKVAADLTERALELDPSNAHAWLMRGLLIAAEGRMEQGLAEVRHGIRLSPQDRRLGKWKALLAGCLLRAGRPDEALREARLAWLRDPNVHVAKLIEALAAHRLDRPYEARAALGAVGDALRHIQRPALQHFLSEDDAIDLMELCRHGPGAVRDITATIGVA